MNKNRFNIMQKTAPSPVNHASTFINRELPNLSFQSACGRLNIIQLQAST